MGATRETRVVQVQVRTPYGQIRIYPMNAEARAFCTLIGTKTLSPGDLGIIESLGFVVEYVPSCLGPNGVEGSES